MKQKTTLIALVLLSFNAIAQNFSQEFQNTITLDARDYTLEDHSSGYTFGITTVEIGNDFRNTVKLITTDFNGIIQNTKVYETVDGDYSIGCGQIINLADGSQIISGTYSINNSPPYFPYIMRVNSDGSVNWAKKIDTNRGSPATIKLLSDGSILVAFKYANPATHFIFCKLDSNGNFSTFKDASIITGQVTAIKAYNTSFEIMLLTGDLINISNDLSTVNWQRKYYNEIGNAFNRTTNGDYIFASVQIAFPGYMTVYRTDASGNLIWAKYIESWDGPIQSQITLFDIVGFHFIKEDNNGNIITSANSEGGLDGSFNVILDANGNYIDNYKIETYRNEPKLLSNDTYLIGGFLNSASYNTSNFILEQRNLTATYLCDTTYSHSIVDGTDMPLTPNSLTLTDITFTIEGFNVTFTTEIVSQNDYCDMSLSVNENILLESDITVFPNPAKNKVWVKSNKTVTQIKLYNYLGQYLSVSNQSFIDISKYANGIYFLEIEINNDYTLVKRIIKN